MKKLTRFQGRLVMGCQQQIMRVAMVAIFFVLIIAPFTSATAQAFRKANAMTSYTFNKPGNGIVPNEAEHVTGKGNEHIIFYPDVVTDYLLVMLPAVATTDVLVTMRAVDGTAIARDVIATGTTNTVMDLKHVQPGTYVITLDVAAAEQVIRLVKN